METQCLFVIVMEYLRRCLGKRGTKPGFNYHPQCEKLQITILCFADDLLLFLRGDETSVQLLMQTFEGFSKDTGLVANASKCKVFLGGVDKAVEKGILCRTDLELVCCHSGIWVLLWTAKT